MKISTHPETEPRPEIAEPRVKRALLYQLSYAPTLNNPNTPTAGDFAPVDHNISTSLLASHGIIPVVRRNRVAIGAFLNFPASLIPNQQAGGSHV